MKKLIFLASLFFLNLNLPGQSIVSVTDTDGWNPWTRSDLSIIGDPVADQQTGQGHSDIVGDGTTFGISQKAGVLDGIDSLLIRVRLEAFRNQGFNNNIIVGMDLDNNGSIDIFMRMGGGTSITFAQPGNGLNTSPSTTTIGTWVNSEPLTGTTYNYLSAPNVFGTNNNDAILTFAVSFQSIQDSINALAPGFENFVMNYNTEMAYIVGTSTQGNALNQDLYGTSGNLNSNLSWGELGSFTAFVGPDAIVPEPSTFVQMTFLMSGIFWMMFIRRKPRKS